MNDKLRDAIDNLQALLDDGALIDNTNDEELQLVLEAAYGPIGTCWIEEDEEC